MRFAIWAPLPEMAPHAGVRVLWRLGRELAARGHDATMWMPGENIPNADVVIIPERTAPRVRHPRVVRWVLLHGGARYRGERIYTWSAAYADAPLLNVPYFDVDEFRSGLHRHGTAVWVGKGTATTIPDDARPITYDTPRQALLEILSTSRSLLSFDAFSAVNIEATLCGTPVTLPMNRPPEMPAGDDYGFRWSDIDNTHMLEEARPRIQHSNSAAQESIDRFVRDQWM